MIMTMTHTYRVITKYHSHITTKAKRNLLQLFSLSTTTMYSTLQVSIGVHLRADCTTSKILGMSISKYMDISLSYKVKTSIFYLKFLFLCKTKTELLKVKQGKNTPSSKHY